MFYKMEIQNYLFKTKSKYYPAQRKYTGQKPVLLSATWIKKGELCACTLNQNETFYSKNTTQSGITEKEDRGVN